MCWGNAVMQQQYQRPVGNEESDMSSTENSLTEPEERPETGSFRKITTLGWMTESIAKELIESLSGVFINARLVPACACWRRVRRTSREHARLRVGRFATATVQRKQSPG